MKYVPSIERYDREQPDTWFKEETTRIVEMPDGENVSIPMTNWHWMSLDWMCTEAGGTLRNTLEIVTGAAARDGTGLVETLRDYIEHYIDIADERGLLGGQSDL